jgi:hypothetical protein
MYDPRGCELQALLRAIRRYQRCPSEANFEEIENLAGGLLRDNQSAPAALVAIYADKWGIDRLLQILSASEEPIRGECNVTLRRGDVLTVSADRKRVTAWSRSGAPLFAYTAPESNGDAASPPPALAQTFDVATAVSIRLDIAGRFVIDTDPLTEARADG